ncbi:MAG: MFS transporter [Candidatus Sericytochromatia bacterium]|nr:MFS transporter [Candidatus Sericytochromatia bacterium]
MRRFSSLAVLAAFLFLTMAGFALIIPVLPQRVADMPRPDLAPDVAMGILMGSYAAVQFVMAPWWGRVSDRRGRRPVLLIGGVGFALALAGMAAAETFSMLLAARLAGGLMAAALLPAALAAVDDLAGEVGRGRGMALAGASLGLGFVLGPALGGWLSMGGDLRLPFVVAAVSCTVVVALAAVVLPETRPADALPRSRSLKQALALSWERGRPLFLAGLLQMMLFSGMEAVLGIHLLERFGMGPAALGATLGVMGLVSAAVAGGGGGRLIERLGENQTLTLAFVAFAGGFALMAFPLGFPGVAAGLFLLGVGSALMRPSLSAGVGRRLPGDAGTGLGALQSFEALGRAVGPLLAGLALHSMGRGAWGISALLALGGIGLGRWAAREGEA